MNATLQKRLEMVSNLKSAESENEGPQDLLAECLAIERPNLVQILDELQRPGLIERARDARDRRVYLLRATPDGLTLVATAGEALRAYDERLTKGLSVKERAALIAALRRVEENGGEAWEGRDVGDLSTT